MFVLSIVRSKCGLDRLSPLFLKVVLKALRENRISKGCGNVDFSLNYSKITEFLQAKLVDFEAPAGDKSLCAKSLHRNATLSPGAGVENVISLLE
jgi:hypothetical protein